VQPAETLVPMEYKGQVTAVQETALNVPPVEQVAVPLPEYPALQVTATACPVVPKIEPAAA